MNFKSLILGCLCALVFFGCADKSIEKQYNKPAAYWYDKMVKAITDGDNEKADMIYESLASEHVASPLLREALLVLAQAHIEDEEYVEANRYLNEYANRFGNPQKNEYIGYLKIKANYSSFSKPNRNQQLVLNTIEDTKLFLKIYPNSPYRPMVESMLVHMELGEYYITQNIVKLYKKLGKEEAAAYYQDKMNESVLKDAESVEPKVPLYRKIFEW